MVCTSFRPVFLPRFQVFPQEIFQETAHDVAGLLLHVRRHMGVGVQGKAGVGMAQDAGQVLASTPLVRAWVAKVCLKSWNRIAGRPASLKIRFIQ